MKKILISSLLLMFAFSGLTMARTVYDSTGRNIVHDGTLRGQKREAALKKEQQRKMQAAAAAKLDYEAALKSLEEPKPKTNFYQDRIQTNTEEK